MGKTSTQIAGTFRRLRERGITPSSTIDAAYRLSREREERRRVPPPRTLKERFVAWVLNKFVPEIERRDDMPLGPALGYAKRSRAEAAVPPQPNWAYKIPRKDA